MDNPLLVFVMLGAAFYVAKLWRDDLRAPHDRSLPGATRSSAAAVWIAIGGALVLLAIETAGERRLGIAEQQSKMTWLFAVYSILGAPVLEELVFRGYLVLRGKGTAALWGSIIGFSAAFALLHQHLWHLENGALSFTFGRKELFTTTLLFASSLWFYTARFAGWNTTQSLLPCFLAHGAKNAGVVLVKAYSGYMQGWW
jgi:membrane protease YdiL (CAAX protease family)